MKSVLKKFIILFAILILLFSVNSEVYGWSKIVQDGKEFISGAETPNGVDTGAIKDASGFLYNILLSSGVVIAVIVATVLGIQFMMSGVEGQAKIKEMIIPFVVGCVIVFGGFGIWKLALTIGNMAAPERGSYTSSGDTNAGSQQGGTSTR